ncbi:hypothetical protein RHMOL_Rhmol01G0005000 [Rhododendron molle]|uniref:Uncharacterized protein n=1 Tax=Rhododendron molle TaxID=49168 RepID=A0ACC0PX62_RHOML|nr:hypothetical protein RHMOL_Rhmol01G0005000 [Rhododendron molle]
MAASLSYSTAALCLSILMLLASSVVPSAASFNQDFDINWGDSRAKILNNGDLLTLSLDKTSGSGFQSKNEYLFGKIDMRLKLVPGNSAGTVTAYYLSSQGSTHDEIDFEFLGNLSGDPYTLHTNVYSQGKGDREQQFRLWFDPSADFHTFSILWNPKGIVFSVDGTPWATRGGLVKTDWTQAPFTTSYANFKSDACIWSSGASSCGGSLASGGNTWMLQELDATGIERMKWVHNNHMIYNYCTDAKRFPQGFSPECKATAS